MCAIPARVAGVAHLTMCTPNAGRETLAAARVAGVDACFEIGGAQAIAAMAFGTKSVPKADLIVGPGNAYVTAAKRLVFGACGIDLLAGPSELAIVASGDADAVLVAADLLAQAEHDVRRACCCSPTTLRLQRVSTQNSNANSATCPPAISRATPCTAPGVAPCCRWRRPPAR